MGAGGDAEGAEAAAEEAERRRRQAVAAVEGYLSAMGARDHERARAFLGEVVTMRFPEAEPMRSADEFLSWSRGRYRRIRKSFAGVDVMRGAGERAVVYIRGTLAGEWPEGGAFEGIRFIDRFELTAGKITHQEVWNDMAAARAGRG